MMATTMNEDLLELFDPSSFLLDADSSQSDNSPSLISDDSTPNSSPPHWSQSLLETELLPLPDISIDVNTDSDMSMFNSLDSQYSTSLVNNIPCNMPTDVSPTEPVLSDTSIIKKQTTRSKKRPRVAEPLPSPTGPDAKIVLPRDQLLVISSQSMDQYAESLASARPLSTDEQKELKKQKRLIKNRESAQLSRERKRAYITQLEDRIQALVNENTHLKNENTGLRQALTHYQTPALTSTPYKDVEYGHKKDPMEQHKNKMGSLLTIGGNNKSTTAKAGVCLLIVLFTFGLFMNATNNNSPNVSVSKVLSFPKREVLPEIPYVEREVSRVPTVGYKRSILEAIPEVLDEDDDLTVLPGKVISEATPVHRHIHPVEIQSAGIYKVTYSTKPAQFLPVGNEKDVPHEHESDNGNRTYMLFLDPRPDLADGFESNTPDVTSSTGLVPKEKSSLPPMIISLVVPKDIGKNGSFPLLPHEGVRPEDSLVEITCQVLDVSITTTETTFRP